MQFEKKILTRKKHQNQYKCPHLNKDYWYKHPGDIGVYFFPWPDSLAKTAEALVKVGQGWSAVPSQICSPENLDERANHVAIM